MINLINNQIIVILAFYHFDFKKSDNKLMKKFVLRFNEFFKSDINEQIITYYCSLFKGVDSSFNAHPVKVEEPRFLEFWNYYIKNERIDLLKKEYSNFKTKNLQCIERFAFEDEADDIIGSHINELSFSFQCDSPKKKYDKALNSSSKSIRDVNVSFNALQIANFICECNANHETFVRKNSNMTYTEGHHLVHLKYQDKFDVNLDVEANIVSLCSQCHNLLHYGRDYETVLQRLFTEDRKQRLQKCGIHISFEELVEMYK